MQWTAAMLQGSKPTWKKGSVSCGPDLSLPRRSLWGYSSAVPQGPLPLPWLLSLPLRTPSRAPGAHTRPGLLVALPQPARTHLLILGDVDQLPKELLDAHGYGGRHGHRAWGGEATEAGKSKDHGHPECHEAAGGYRGRGAGLIREHRRVACGLGLWWQLL